VGDLVGLVLQFLDLAGVLFEVKSRLRSEDARVMRTARPSNRS
jgi:hypothetical protein